MPILKVSFDIQGCFFALQGDFLQTTLKDYSGSLCHFHGDWALEPRMSSLKCLHGPRGACTEHQTITRRQRVRRHMALHVLVQTEEHVTIDGFHSPKFLYISSATTPALTAAWTPTTLSEKPQKLQSYVFVKEKHHVNTRRTTSTELLDIDRDRERTKKRKTQRHEAKETDREIKKYRDRAGKNT